jgi:penicillin-binding protein 2
MRRASKGSVFDGRLRFAGVSICLVLALLLLRIWYLQGIKGDYFRDLSENNRTRTVRTIAPRGNIYDREKKILVQNRPAFNVSLMLEDTPDVTKTLEELSATTGRDVEVLKEMLKGVRRRSPFQPQVVMADVSRPELETVKVSNHRLPGVMIDVAPTRAYPHKDVAAHVLGYVREVSRPQLAKLKKKSDQYRKGDIVGQSGIEKTWEQELQGIAGYRRVEVDAKGKRRGELGIVDDSPGHDLYLTLDYDLQVAAQRALDGQNGSVVAIDPRNGEILALASAPSFDANILAGRTSPEDWKQLRDNPDHPLTNRSIAENYAPGSIFKLIMGLAGLSEKVIHPGTELDCPGYYYFAGRRYRCHKRSGHGKVNMKDAIKMSCDSYFYQLGRKLGIGIIHKYSSMFGLGKRTGIDLPGERSGIAPSNEWKLKYLGERWYPGETLSVSIGQGFLTVTPLQMAVSVAALVNGGTLFEPFLVKDVVDRTEGNVYQHQPKGKELPLNKKLLKKIMLYAESVVAEKKGTGGKAAIEGIRVGGKTGTAQVVALGKETLKKKFNDHAWFVSFAPVEEPTIVMAIIVENGGHGGAAAAPISKEVMSVYFRKKGLLAPEELEEAVEDQTLDVVADNHGHEHAHQETPEVG